MQAASKLLEHYGPVWPTDTIWKAEDVPPVRRIMLNLRVLEVAQEMRDGVANKPNEPVGNTIRAKRKQAARARESTLRKLAADKARSQQPTT